MPSRGEKVPVSGGHAPPASSREQAVAAGTARPVGAQTVPWDFWGDLERAKRFGHSLERISIDVPGARVADEQVRQSASEGLRTPGSPLPHAERLQPAFGRHSLSRLQAHLGATASASAAAMDAEAFTAGRHVVFAGTPDVYTVAHEAVHAFRQMGGTRPEGGVGREGDRHEQEADAIARRAASGQSVEATVDGFMSGPGMVGEGAPSLGAIQRLTDNERALLRHSIAAELAQNNLPHDAAAVQRVMNAVAPVQSLVQVSPLGAPAAQLMLAPSRVDEGLTLQVAWWRAQIVISRLALLAAPPAPVAPAPAPAPQQMQVVAQAPQPPAPAPQPMQVEKESMPPAPVLAAQQHVASSSSSSLQYQQNPVAVMAVGSAASAAALAVQGQQVQQAQIQAPKIQSLAPAKAPLSEAELFAKRAAKFGGAEDQLKELNLRAQQAKTVAANLSKAASADIVIGASGLKHLTDQPGDKAAGLTFAEAKAKLRAAAGVEYHAAGQGKGPEFKIRYGSNLNILFSTANEGRTVFVFHIGPGGG